MTRTRSQRDPVHAVRLLGPFDLFLQAKDRPLLVADPRPVKTLWPTLGRPGAVLVDGEIAGTWRPRKSGRTLTVRVEPWTRITKPRTRRGAAAGRAAGGASGASGWPTVDLEG